MHRIAITALVMMLVVLAGCGSADEARDGGGGEEAGAAALAPQDDSGAERAADADDSAAGDSGDDAVAENTGEAEMGGSGEVPEATVVTSPGDRLIRDGTMRLEVEEGGFSSAFERAVSAARRLGGDMLSSDERTDDDGLMSGTLTLRVPAEDYDALLIAVTDIGEVQRRSTTSEDVTTEFVDLEARLRHNEAQERFYLSLLEDADGVEDAIAIQQRVSGIQQAIEEIQGRLRYLEERTAFSRLTVELYETGAAVERGGQRPTFAQYFATARDALVTVLGGALVVATVALPLALLGVVALLVYRRVAVPGRRALSTNPAATAPGTDT